MKPFEIPSSLVQDVTAAVQENPGVMLRDLAQRFGVTEGAVAQALPAEMRAFAPVEAFDRVWEAMASWQAVTVIACTPGMIMEFKGTLPGGKHGHGMFNLHAENHPLGGHFFVKDLGAICFLSKPFFGLESHSVQFYNTRGEGMCAVYVGREGRKLIDAVRDAYMALRDAVCVREEK